MRRVASYALLRGDFAYTRGMTVTKSERRYVVRGQDRAQGALGTYTPFVVIVSSRAASLAMDACCADRYAHGREHVHVKTCLYADILPGDSALCGPYDVLATAKGE